MHSDIKLYRAADNAVDGFFICMQNFESPKPPFELTCMFDYIEDWLKNGPAVEDCCQHFQVYLTAVTLIIASWSEGMDPKDWSEMSKIKQVMDPERSSYDILDPQVFMIRRDELHDERIRVYGCRLPNQG